jgi:hypothetical protein
MKITTIGLDIAKNVFQIHGVNKKGKAVYLVKAFLNKVKCLAKQLEQFAISQVHFA